MPTGLLCVPVLALGPSKMTRPDFSTIARETIFSVAGMFCSTMTTVVPVSR